MNQLVDEKKRLKLSMIWTAIFGIIAHGYAMANLLVSHDALFEFYSEDTVAWKNSLGRFLEPLLWKITGESIVMPWLSGVIAILIIGLVVYLVGKMYAFDKLYQIIIVAGIFVTNITMISCIATFTHDLVSNMLALLFAVLAAYMWNVGKNEFKIIHLIASIVLFGLSLAFYQSMISVGITMIIIGIIFEVINGEKFKGIFSKGVYAVIGFFGGGVVYFATTKIFCSLFKSPLMEGNYNSVTNVFNCIGVLPIRLLRVYKNMIKYFALPSNDAFHFIGIINLLFLLVSLSAIIYFLIKGKNGVLEKLTLLFLLILLPWVMEIAFIGSGVSHDLMHYSHSFLYVLTLVLLQWYDKKGCVNKKQMIPTICCVLVSILLFHNCQTANLTYVKKDLECNGTMAAMTRVLYHIEEQDEYEFGKTPVAFIGKIAIQGGVVGCENIKSITGSEYDTQITYHGTYKKFFQNILQYDINVLDEDSTNEFRKMKIVKEMPVFPKKGSVAMIDGVIVVKLDEC